MSGSQPALSGRAEELRRAFDRSFAVPLATTVRTTVDFIAVRLAGDAHAIRLAEIGGLFVDMPITPCPSRVASLRGIAGFRGTLTPVYDLAALLGYPLSSSLRWLILTQGRELALAFDDFGGHFRTELEAIASREGPGGSGHIREIARQPDRAWPVIDISSIASAIRKQIPNSPSGKE
jgi:chemotaxis signal transduction protein